MVTASIPSPEQIERLIAGAAARGIDEAMVRLVRRARDIAPYDPKRSSGKHLRDTGSVKWAKTLPGGSVQGGAKFLVRNPLTGYPYAPVQHEGFYFDSKGRRVPAEGYFRYQNPKAKREFLTHALRTNRSERTVAKHIRASIKLANRGRWL